jgi:hypothetical protein
MLAQPPARSVDDAQTDHEKADSDKDLDATLLRLGGDLAGGARTRTRPNVNRPYMSQYVLVCIVASTKAAAAISAVAHVGGAMIAMGIAAAAPTAVPIAFPPIRSRLPIRTYKVRIRIGSGTQ